MSKPMRASLHLRVSTDKQTSENQRLEAAAAARGWDVVATYCDHGISGAKGRDKRPGLDGMLKEAIRRKFDMVMAWSVDRLGRSLADLVSTMQDLQSAKVGMYLHQQGLDTTTPSGRAIYQMSGVFAEFERAMSSHKDGTLKKPHGRARTSVEAQILERLTAGESIRGVIRETGAGSGTVQRVKREMDGAR